MGSTTVTLQHITLHLLPQRTVFIPQWRILCLADWHLGKAAYMRQAGIGMSQPALHKDFAIVSQLIEQYDPLQIVLLGDVFHSELTNDWLLFSQFVAQYSSIEWILTLGNHDIIDRLHYNALGIKTVDSFTIDQKLVFSHHPTQPIAPHQLQLCGHVHPGVLLYGAARQRFRLPCFHYQNKVLTLPAFGSLTGLYLIKKTPQNQIFAILGNTVKAL